MQLTPSTFLLGVFCVCLYKLQHISFPLNSNADCLIATPPDETPPALGQPLHEPPEAKKERLGTNSFGVLDPQNTYTFSFHSMYIDMPAWSTKNIKGLRDMDLHTFWGRSALRICAYVMPNRGGNAVPGATAKLKQHLQSDIRYLMCLQVLQTSILGPISLCT